ncbi:MAG: hypothetical protein AB7L90_20665 [Hyphomicrobiaceae bacterium]
MIPVLRPVLGAAFLALASSAALSQSATPPASPSDPAKSSQAPLAVCRADVDKLCPGSKGGKRRACLKDNAAKLSPECATAFTEIESKAKAMREACADDVKTHCASAPKGKGGSGIVQCLRVSSEKLSAACRTAFTARYGG